MVNKDSNQSERIDSSNRETELKRASSASNIKTRVTEWYKESTDIKYIIEKD